MPNRLAREPSLYLRQHADNPVDWYPWGDEAFARARAEDRPVLLSIGYSSCHWCHVMAHESFEDPLVAAVMNESFVCVKVDREERPDVDALYMQATIAMSGHGGWPMTVILTPDGAPFFAGTYFPPRPAHGRPSFTDVLEHARRTFAERRDDVEDLAARMTDALRAAGDAAPAGPIDRSALDDAVTGLAVAFDASAGGFGGAPKFPPHVVLDFLLRRLWSRPADTHVARMVEQTLGAMADGGIHDQLGGGFHRYSVDRVWLVPHFEKMLYDNALLAGVYALAARVTGDPRWHAVAESTFDYLLREMRLDEGGFAASQDADSPGGEGAYFVWTDAELRRLLTPAEHAAFADRYGVRPEGNFEGANVLHLARMEPAADADIASARLKLLAARSRRAAPVRDDAVICSWNALTVRALADGAVALDRPDLLAAAVTGAELILERMVVGDRLRRVLAADTAHGLATLEDHANLVVALLALHDATFDWRWVDAAAELAARAVSLFGTPDGGFVTTGADAPALLAPTRDVEDSPTPAGQPQLALGLLRLAELTADQDRWRRGIDALAGVTAVVTRAPQAFGTALRALDLATAPDRRQIAIVHPPGADPAELVRIARRAGPHTTVAVGVDDGAGRGILHGRRSVSGRPTAYVCAGQTCSAPVTDAGQLTALLDA